jgi:TM2 domain-containing membrane protein YozV
MITCPNCGATADESELKCRYCSQPLVEANAEPSVNDRFQGEAPHAPEPPPFEPKQQQQQAQQQYQTPPQGQYQQPNYQQQGYQQPNYQQQGQPNYQQQGQYYQNQQYPPPPYGQAPYSQPYPGYDPRYRDINKIVAGIFAILLGTFGVHKFYMGRIGLGVLCIIFCWTGIPSLIGVIEGIIYLCMNDAVFREKYARRW